MIAEWFFWRIEYARLEKKNKTTRDIYHTVYDHTTKGLLLLIIEYF